MNDTHLINLDIKQNFKPDNDNKILYGEVNTPFSLIKEMFSIFPEEIFSNPDIKWLDPATGCGYFPMVLYNLLMNGLREKINNPKTRSNHILQHMIYMCEINEKNINSLKSLFGDKAQIHNYDFLSTNTSNFMKKNQKFNVIIGNPPYNSNGMKKVPTNTKLNKKQDGITSWTFFIKHSMSMLREDGYLNMIIPSIWMKPDKAKMFQYMTQYKIHKLKTFTNTQTKNIFKGQAQTPTCYFLLQKRQTDNKIAIFDDIYKTYMDYTLTGSSIPLLGISVVNRVKRYADTYGRLNVIKTSLPSSHNKLSYTQDKQYTYKNIKTTRLQGLQPSPVLEFSTKPCAYNGEKKLILAHKMYGFPYYDKNGIYGISNRDNYVILGYDNDEFLKIQQFLNSDLVMYLYETTRYRMKYLEKYVFEFIPNILNIPDFPNEINNETINLFFGFSQQEISYFSNFHKKYKLIVD